MLHNRPPQKLKKASGKKWKREAKSTGKHTNLLFKQHDALIRMQSGYLDLESLINLSMTCKLAHTLVNDTFLLQRLVQHVLRGEQAQAVMIIHSRPELLLKKITVVDDFGRTLKDVSPITAAYGADDVEMCATLLQVVDNPSRIKAIDQILEQFPEKKEAKVEPYDFGPIIAAVLADKDLEATIEKFRKEVVPSVIKQGKHFNMDIFLGAFKTLEDHWDLWSAKQRSLFYQGVIGNLQPLLPACFARAFGQDSHRNKCIEIAKKAVTLNRDLTLDGRYKDQIALMIKPILEGVYQKNTLMLKKLPQLKTIAQQAEHQTKPK